MGLRSRTVGEPALRARDVGRSPEHWTCSFDKLTDRTGSNHHLAIEVVGSAPFAQERAVHLVEADKRSVSGLSNVAEHRGAWGSVLDAVDLDPLQR